MSDATPSLVDRAQLASISSGMEEMVIAIIEDFRSNALTDLHGAIERESGKHAEAMVDLFHQVKGSGGTLGMTVLQEQCRLLEERGRRGSSVSNEEIRQVASLVEESCLQAKSFL